MVATTEIDVQAYIEGERVYAVFDGRTARLFQRDPTDVGRESGRYYLDTVKDTVVHIEEGEDTWSVVDVAGEFEWDRHPMWIYDRIDRAEWLPLRCID